jgi:Fe-S cluster biosynthesis and repair protein YggX
VAKSDRTEPARRPATVKDGAFACRRCGEAGRRLAEPPFRGELGIQVQQSVCADCWTQWVAMGTKVINELHLRLSKIEAQNVYDQHMIEFLNLDAPASTEAASES